MLNQSRALQSDAVREGAVQSRRDVSDERRVVVTGLGVACAGGNTLDALVQFLRNGVSAPRFDPELERLGFLCHVSARAQLRTDELDECMTSLEQRRLRGVGIHYGLHAGVQAFRDAGFTRPQQRDPRVGVVFGAGVVGLDTLGEALQNIEGGRVKKLGSSAIEMQMPSIVASILAAKCGAGGQVTCNSSACATGTEAVLIAAERIRMGYADVVLAGSSESEGACLWGAFDALRVLARTNNHDPARASRPLSASSSGFIAASGAGALVLESLAHARSRGARIYCELLGGAANCGAQEGGGSMTRANASAMVDCIRGALGAANVQGSELDAIAGHLTGTGADVVEVGAWSQALERSGADFPRIASAKSLLGHALSASGAIELVIAALQLHHKFLHPSLNCEDLHPEIENCISQEQIVRAALDYPELALMAKASFGFGDVNAVVILRGRVS